MAANDYLNQTSPPPTGGLGFGCAGLFRLPSARARRRVLEAAFDAGITHFDVAPMYGLGAAEPELGNFARTRRERVVIATKFGIDATRFARGLGRVQGPVRRVLEARPGLKATARASAPGPASGLGSLLYTKTGYGPSAARASLEQSLRSLRTDHLDLFLLHDPTLASVRAQDIAEYLQRAKGQGLIRAWGVAGEPTPVLAVADNLTVPPAVLQFRDDIFMRSIDRIEPELSTIRITFGSLGFAIDRVVAYLQRERSARERWSSRVGQDCADPEVVAGLLLRHARRRNPGGVTLFSTVRVKRLAKATAAARSATLDDSVAVFAGLIDAELADREPRDGGR